jgi:ABC-type dipeptide/oligopeptide/nickel transport system ATPase component
MSTPLLQVNALTVEFSAGRIHRAVDAVSLAIGAQEIVGLVGESGSGKTVLSLSLLRLVPRPGVVRSGQLLWQGRDLLALPADAMRKVRGRDIAMIFQNPQSSLNPVRTIGTQMSAVIRLHQDRDRAAAREEALRWLSAVRIADPDRVYAAYPHQCSGGMCQRILIAMALACRPKLLIADEPTASLDVTIQAQIMDLLLEIRERYGTAILLVSHDLGVIARLCDRIAVMYGGRIVEQADALSLYRSPQHPYTRMLLQSVPVPDPTVRPVRTPISDTDGLSLAGDADAAAGAGAGVGGSGAAAEEGWTDCRFRHRCPDVMPECALRPPPLIRLDTHPPGDSSGPLHAGAHDVACFRRMQEHALQPEAITASRGAALTE